LDELYWITCVARRNIPREDPIIFQNRVLGRGFFISIPTIRPANYANCEIKFAK
jgi:hypothetical protein